MVLKTNEAGWKGMENTATKREGVPHSGVPSSLLPTEKQGFWYNYQLLKALSPFPDIELQISATLTRHQSHLTRGGHKLALHPHPMQLLTTRGLQFHPKGLWGQHTYFTYQDSKKVGRGVSPSNLLRCSPAKAINCNSPLNPFPHWGMRSS